MLRKASYQIISMALLINFLAASAGLSLYIHKCSCERRLITTLFVKHKCHNEQTSTCCSKHHKNSIQTKSNCGCKTEYLNLKVNDFYVFSSQIQLLTKFDFSKTFALNDQEKDLFKALNNTSIECKLYLPNESPPIKAVSKELIIQLHQSKDSNLIS
jgi:hypothetical protein